MKTTQKSEPDVITEITKFLTTDLLQEEIQKLPNDLQEVFDLVLDTEHGNSLVIRRKMLRFKELAASFAKALEPFTEEEIQESCLTYQNEN